MIIHDEINAILQMYNGAYFLLSSSETYELHIECQQDGLA